KKKTLNLLPILPHTFSKAPYSYVEGVYPAYVKSGRGSHLQDVDGNDYIDYVLGLGPIILGYNYPEVNQAIMDTLKEGTTFSMPHYLEIEFADLLCSVIPSAEMAKFTKTGSDAVTAAVRAARAITGKDKVAYCGGGGVWHDWFIISTSRNLGVPKFNRELIKIFQYNKIETLEQIFEQNKGQIAAVCIEPMVYEPPKTFLKDVQRIAHENEAILIFDEVVTGFRMSLGGAQQYFDIKPDLSCFGKAIGNGMPLGAITGKKEYMKIFDEIFYSTTYAGEILSLAAGKATISTIKEKNVITYLWNKGSELKTNFQKIVRQMNLPVDVIGLPHRIGLIVKDDSGAESITLKSILYQECVKRGIIFGSGSIFHTFSHTDDDTKKTVEAFIDAAEILRRSIDSEDPSKFLHGNPMKPVLKFPVL
ncbi:MAG: aminotransferase class III-fold pyridoxal phosphate-dependent enzyme, partial [Candidatus Nitrosotenuis sp.]